MAKTVQIVARLDAETVQAIDRMPGKTRTEKLRNLVAQRSVVAALLDEQKMMLAQVQKAVASMAQKPPVTAPVPASSAPTNPGVLTPQELAALYQALALISNAISKPGMASEAANFCAGKVREIMARQ
jgi:hypothetical protein